MSHFFAVRRPEHILVCFSVLDLLLIGFGFTSFDLLFEFPSDHLSALMAGLNLHIHSPFVLHILLIS